MKKHFKQTFFLFFVVCVSYAQTIEQLQQQLHRAQAQSDINDELKANVAIAKYYEKQNNYEQAVVFYRASLAIFEKNNQKENMAVCYASIGNVFLKSGKYSESVDWNNKAIKLFEQLNDQNNLAYTLMLNGDNYVKLKLTEKAISFFEKSTTIYKTINDNKSEAVVLNKIGSTYSSYGNYDKALLYLNKAFKIASSASNMTVELSQINKNIEVVKKNSANTENVKTDFIKQKEVEAQQTIVGLSTQNIKSLEEIEQLSIEAQVKELKIKAQQEQLLLKQLQVEKQKKEYEYLQKEKEYERIKHEEKIYRQQLIIFTVSILSLLLFIIALIIYKYYKAKKKAVALLKEKNREILEKSEQIKNQAVEIARYQSQMNPHFIFNAINGFQNEILEGNKESSLNQIQSFAKLLRLTLNNSQNEYISVEDEILYLNKYVEFELHRFAKKFKFNVNIEEGVLLNYKIPTMLIQPIIENTIKHAGLNKRDGGEINLNIKKNIEHPTQILIITVVDNGIGISIHSTPFRSVQGTHTHHESKGTSITKQRIKLALEKLNIMVNDFFVITSPVYENEKYKGTQTTIRVPFLIEEQL